MTVTMAIFFQLSDWFDLNLPGTGGNAAQENQKAPRQVSLDGDGDYDDGDGGEGDSDDDDCNGDSDEDNGESDDDDPAEENQEAVRQV